MTIIAEDYQLLADNGNPIRKATKVTFEECGHEIKFTEKMPKTKAIAQAKIYHDKSDHKRSFPIGQKACVHGRHATIIGYDKELDVYTARIWEGLRHVGDVIVPEQEIKDSDEDGNC